MFHSVCKKVEYRNEVELEGVAPSMDVEIFQTVLFTPQKC